MANSDSKLVTVFCWLPTYNYATQKSKVVSIQTPHHAAGNLSIARMAQVWKGKKVSANYGIQTDGTIGQFVHEKDRAYTSCNSQDAKAITIEVANCKGAPYWEVSDAAIKSLINLSVDICKRNGMKELKWTGDKKGSLTCHYMFKATACPGPYMKALMPWIAMEVTGRVNGTITGDIKVPQVKFSTPTTTKTTTAKTTTSTSTNKTTTQTDSFMYGGLDLSPVFNYKYYADRYVDVRNAYGYNAQLLFTHFCAHGMKEWRQGTSTFNPITYMNNYPDIKNACGVTNPVLYYKHYLEHGIKEGRKGY